MYLFFILYALAAICILDEPFSAVLYIFWVHILLFLFLFVDSLDQNLHTDQSVMLNLLVASEFSKTFVFGYFYLFAKFGPYGHNSAQLLTPIRGYIKSKKNQSFLRKEYI